MKKESGLFIGIDPGVTGGIARIFIYRGAPSMLDLYKMPKRIEQIRDIIVHLLGIDFPATIVIEQVHSSPKQGVASAFTFGENYGLLKGICLSVVYRRKETQIIDVTPQNWQAALNCRTGGDKKISQAKAKELFPGWADKMTLATSDAALLAYYGYLKNE